MDMDLTLTVFLFHIKTAYNVCSVNYYSHFCSYGLNSYSWPFPHKKQHKMYVRLTTILIFSRAFKAWLLLVVPFLIILIEAIWCDAVCHFFHVSGLLLMDILFCAYKCVYGSSRRSRIFECQDQSPYTYLCNRILEVLGTYLSY